MAQYPIRMELPKSKPAVQNRPAKPVTQGDLNRFSRTQGEEAKESKVMKAKGGKCYAKGGSASARADGIAKKGKTKGTEIKMAKGGRAKGCK
jgi:hypothetical protein